MFHFIWAENGGSSGRSRFPQPPIYMPHTDGSTLTRSLSQARNIAPKSFQAPATKKVAERTKALFRFRLDFAALNGNGAT